MTQSRKVQRNQIKDKKESKKFFIYLGIVTLIMMALAYLFYTLGNS